MSRETADVVVVGAGVIGLSIAFQIARRTNQRIVVLDKASNVGEGSTGASCAILRQRYSHPESIMLARDGLRVYRAWASFTGIDEPRAAFHHTGVLWMMGETPDQVASAEALMSGLGIDMATLSAADVVDRFPALSPCNDHFDLTFETEHECSVGGPFLFETEGGYFDPVSACQDLAEAARLRGVDIRFNTKVTGVRTSGGRVEGVDLADGSSIDAPVVVNGAGPWGPQLAQMAGLDWKWDIHPIRAQVIYREWNEEVPGPLPVVADSSAGIYFRPETGGQQILIGSIREEDEQEVVADPDIFNGNIDRAFRDTKVYGLHHRIPSLPFKGGITGLAGMYTLNADDVHAVVGRTEIEGFVVANGFSGHGFKEAPAVGSMVARWLTGESDPYDTEAPIEFFAIDRDPIEMETKAVLA